MPFVRVPEPSAEKALKSLRPEDYLASSTVQKAKSLVRKGRIVAVDASQLPAGDVTLYLVYDEDRTIPRHFVLRVARSGATDLACTCPSPSPFCSHMAAVVAAEGGRLASSIPRMTAAPRPDDPMQFHLETHYSGEALDVAREHLQSPPKDLQKRFSRVMRYVERRLHQVGKSETWETIGWEVSRRLGFPLHFSDSRIPPRLHKLFQSMERELRRIDGLELVDPEAFLDFLDTWSAWLDQVIYEEPYSIYKIAWFVYPFHRLFSRVLSYTFPAYPRAWNILLQRRDLMYAGLRMTAEETLKSWINPFNLGHIPTMTWFVDLLRAQNNLLLAVPYALLRPMIPFNDLIPLLSSVAEVYTEPLLVMDRVEGALLEGAHEVPQEHLLESLALYRNPALLYLLDDLPSQTVESCLRTFVDRYTLKAVMNTFPPGSPHHDAAINAIFWVFPHVAMRRWLQDGQQLKLEALVIRALKKHQYAGEIAQFLLTELMKVLEDPALCDRLPRRALRNLMQHLLDPLLLQGPPGYTLTLDRAMNLWEALDPEGLCAWLPTLYPHPRLTHRAYVRKMLAKRMERCDDAGVP